MPSEQINVCLNVMTFALVFIIKSIIKYFKQESDLPELQKIRTIMKHVGMLNSTPITMTEDILQLFAQTIQAMSVFLIEVHNREHGQMAWPHMPRL